MLSVPRLVPALPARVLPRVRRGDTATDPAPGSQPDAAEGRPRFRCPGQRALRGDAGAGRTQDTPLHPTLLDHHRLHPAPRLGGSDGCGAGLRRVLVSLREPRHPRRALGRGDGTGHIRLHQHRAPPGSDLERTDNLVRSFEGPPVRSIDTNPAGRFVRERATEFAVEVERNQLARHDISVCRSALGHERHLHRPSKTQRSAKCSTRSRLFRPRHSTHCTDGPSMASRVAFSASISVGSLGSIS